MPIVEPGQTDKEVEDFAAAFAEDDDKRSDEEVKPDGEESAAGSGDPTKELDTATTVTPKTEDPLSGMEGQAAAGEVKPAEPATTIDPLIESRIVDLEAALKKERQRTSSWDGRIKAANKKVADLEAENKELRDKLISGKKEEPKAGDDMSDQEKIEMFKTSFPELADFADIMDRKIKTIPEPAKAKTEAKPKEEEFVEEKEGTSDSEHWSTVTKAHPEVDEIVASKVLLSYINQQPDFNKSYMSDIYFNTNGYGTSKNVINLITNFKEKTGWKSQSQNSQEIEKDKQNKLNSMLETGDGSAGPKKEGPDKNDFDGTAKEIGL